MFRLIKVTVKQLLLPILPMYSHPNLNLLSSLIQSLKSQSLLILSIPNLSTPIPSNLIQLSQIQLNLNL